MNNSEKIEELKKLREEMLNAKDSYEFDKRLFGGASAVGFISTIGAIVSYNILLNSNNFKDEIIPGVSLLVCIGIAGPGIYAFSNIAESKWRYKKALKTYLNKEYDNYCQTNEKSYKKMK